MGEELGNYVHQNMGEELGNYVHPGRVSGQTDTPSTPTPRSSFGTDRGQTDRHTHTQRERDSLYGGGASSWGDRSLLSLLLFCGE